VKETCDISNTPHFRARDVAFRLEKNLSAAAGMGEDCDQVGHRPARHETGGRLAGSFRGERFERPDRWVAVARVVAEFGVAHPLEHPFGRERDGVASEIDRIHRLSSHI